MSNTKKMTSIKTLEDLINLNLGTLENVANEMIDNRRAVVIFMGSRTVTGAMKIGLEALKAGLSSVGGVKIGEVKKIQ